MTTRQIKIFSGTAHRLLTENICNHLHVTLGRSLSRKMPDSEFHILIEEVVRDQDIFFIQPCCPPVNDNLIETLLYLDAFRRASAHSINVVMPYFPYSRQERMSVGRESISARVVANLLEVQGASRVLFVDIHNPAIQGFFNIPVDPISAVPILVKHLQVYDRKLHSIVSPDVGRAKLAGKFSEMLGLPLVVMHKCRTGTETTTTHVVGEIAGRTPIVIDDIIASGSVLKQIDCLYARGAVGKTIFAITHGLLLPSAMKILQNDDRIDKLVITDSVPFNYDLPCAKIEIVSIAGMLADVIQSIHEGTSIMDKVMLS